MFAHLPRIQFLLIMLACFTVVYGCSETMEPEEAFRSLEANPLQADVLVNSVEALKAGMERNPEDPWVYLGFARAHLINGYQSGSRFDAENFDPQSLEKARLLVEHALELNPTISRAHAMRARLQIIQGQYREAWDTLNKAHELDRTDFNPWYLMGILNRYYGEHDQSRKMLRRAASAVEYPYQTRWVMDQRLELAEAMDDPAAEERVHLEVVATFPERAHGYGNYGAFLLEQDRYEEAIVQYEKALEIQRYPLAEEQLAKARRLAAESH